MNLLNDGASFLLFFLFFPFLEFLIYVLVLMSVTNVLLSAFYFQFFHIQLFSLLFLLLQHILLIILVNGTRFKLNSQGFTLRLHRCVLLISFNEVPPLVVPLEKLFVYLFRLHALGPIVKLQKLSQLLKIAFPNGQAVFTFRQL